ncbi:unknown similar to AMEV101 [Adoxophyes honmai entomopoxvirus 'L']|uniref:Phospholipase A2-like domain-containing protein n=1 Tax=Adoxophyes honmai entomopoxvirus 'L' TaxID=1293540 RepID=A0A916KP27_9POXV|nr:unknown similar to AMEV101 [Adoxophyes honmai entomopoxvirus 'L']CCU55430.1 unknown similar to AMEV101 [Adoxophyes honmai entomopoxvirus 'L']
MECEICKNYYITKFTSISLDNIIILTIECDKCSHNTQFNIKIPKEYYKDKKITPLHLPKYNYCGPYTNVIKNIVQDVKPYNDIDTQCLLHDLSYHMYKDNTSRCKADVNLIKYLNNLTKKSVSKHIIKLVLDIKNIFAK